MGTGSADICRCPTRPYLAPGGKKFWIGCLNFKGSQGYIVRKNCFYLKERVIGVLKYRLSSPPSGSYVFAPLVNQTEVHMTENSPKTKSVGVIKTDMLAKLNV